MSSIKQYSIVIYGATGFTGSLVLKYLVASKIARSSIAVAGRSRSKLEKLLDESDAKDVDIIVADSMDSQQLEVLVKQTKVVLSLVGPYTLYGEQLVRLCCENGTSYVDLTGEASWCAKMIQRYGSVAIDSGALIVHSCGFDSIPSDLCSFLAVQQLRKSQAVEVGQVRSMFSMNGSASGGTLASAFAVMDGSAEDRRVSMNPFCLSPIPGNHKPSIVVARSSTYKNKRSWGGFFIMAPHNEAIVRRSWGILESAVTLSTKALAYGPRFEYSELMLMPGPISAAVASFVIYFTAGMLIFVAPIRRLLQRYGPQPGSGPSIEQQKNGWFKCTTTATSTDSQHQVQVTMKGSGDPGYACTSKMIAECALAIVEDSDRLPLLAKKGGFLTPATAFGNVLVERLEATGTFSFHVEDGKRE